MKTKPTFAEHLMAIPNVGDDANFERVQEIEILGGMIDQANKSTSRAESVVDQALAEVNASNLRLEALETQAKARLMLRGSVRRFDDPTAPVSEDDWGSNAETCAATEASAIAHKSRKKYKLAELLAECDPSAPPLRVDGWDEMVPVGKEILDDQGHKT